MTAIALADRQTAVYRLFGAKRSLLYVGISCDPNERIKDHQAEKPWWPSVKRISITWFENRVGALRHEAWAIAVEVPLFNKSRPNPRRFSAETARPNEAINLPGLSIGEAAKRYKVAPAKLARLVAEDRVPHSGRGKRIWFSNADIAALDIRVGARASVAMGQVFADMERLRAAQP